MSMNLNPAKMPWMQSADVVTLFGAFPEGSLRFVGGCVRNAIWNEPVGDIDLACQLNPEAVTSALAAAEIRYVPTGIEPVSYTHLTLPTKA